MTRAAPGSARARPRRRRRAARELRSIGAPVQCALELGQTRLAIGLAIGIMSGLAFRFAVGLAFRFAVGDALQPVWGIYSGSGLIVIVHRVLPGP